VSPAKRVHEERAANQRRYRCHLLFWPDGNGCVAYMRNQRLRRCPDITVTCACRGDAELTARSPPDERGQIRS